MPSKNEAEKLARVWIEGWIAGKPDDIPLVKISHTQVRSVQSPAEKNILRG